jgi:hypothetical protein
MAQVTTSAAASLSWVPLTEPVTRVLADLPKPLPDILYKEGPKIPGNRYRRAVFRPSRLAARMTPYGAPPRTTPQTGAGFEDLVMIHSAEQADAGPEILEFFHNYEDYRVQQMAEQELDRRARDFAIRQMNLRNTCIHMGLSYGKIFFDKNGELDDTDTSESGSNAGGYTLDYKVPAGNITATGVDFSNAAADIVGWVVGFKQTYMQATGRRHKYFICGKNVSGYLAKNTGFKEYLRYNRPVSDEYIRSGLIPSGVTILDTTWIFAQDAFFVKSSGSIVTAFGDDKIVALPEIDSTVYDLKIGSVPIPKSFMSFQSGGDFNSVIRDMLSNQGYGAVQFAYGTALPFPQITMVQADTFLPDWKNPNVIYILDSTP